LHIKNAFYSPKSNRNLLSFNGYLTRIKSNIKCVMEKLSAFSYGLYYTYINVIEMHVIVS